MIIDLIFRYGIFVIVAFQGLKLGLMWPHLSRPARIFASCFVGIGLLWGLLTVLGGYASVFFVFSAPFTQPAVACFWSSYFLFLWGTTLWVVWGNGAAVLAESGMIGGPGLQTAMGVKIFFVAFSILFPIMLWFAQSSGLFAQWP